MSEVYDVVVLGAGPAGQSAAAEAARCGKRVLLVEARSTLGGVCLHEGTIPSKSLREAVLALSGYRAAQVEGRRPAKWPKLDAGQLVAHVERVVTRELSVIDRYMDSVGVEVVHGRARFASDREVDVEEVGRIRAEAFVVATGSVARRLEGVPFDGKTVVDSDDLLPALERLPDRMVIVGGGVVGSEYASIFSLAGVEVHLVFSGERPLAFVDRDLVAVLEEEYEANGVVLHAGVSAERVDVGSGQARVHLSDGSALDVDLVLYAVGRVGSAGSLNVEAAGLETSRRGLLSTDESFRTRVPHIFAVGDVAGGAALASVAKVQGRIAARALCGLPTEPIDEHRLPFGIFTIPEMAWVGHRLAELERSAEKVVTGVARTNVLARGEIAGDRSGLLRLVFRAEDGKLVEAAMAGTDAVELVHVAKVAMECGADLDTMLRGVWNYPTYGEAYRIAALEAEAALRGGFRSEEP